MSSRPRRARTGAAHPRCARGFRRPRSMRRCANPTARRRRNRARSAHGGRRSDTAAGQRRREEGERQKHRRQRSFCAASARARDCGGIRDSCSSSSHLLRNSSPPARGWQRRRSRHRTRRATRSRTSFARAERLCVKAKMASWSPASITSMPGALEEFGQVAARRRKLDHIARTLDILHLDRLAADDAPVLDDDHLRAIILELGEDVGGDDEASCPHP